jgi:phage shock protein A
MGVFRRLANVIKGMFSSLVGGIERSNPDALLQLESDNLREQIAKYNQGLASHAALCERLMGQIKSQEVQERELRAKIKGHLRAGNKTAAGQHALRHQALSRDLTENNKQLEAAEKTYKDLLKARDVSIQSAKNKIDSLRRKMSDMKVKQATAELTEMAAGMVSEIGGAGDTLSRLEEMVEHDRAEASGRARVARDALSMADIDLQETEQDALAEAALADFAAEEGLAIEADEAATPLPQDPEPGATETGKSMGPEAETAVGEETPPETDPA